MHIWDVDTPMVHPAKRIINEGHSTKLHNYDCIDAGDNCADVKKNGS